MEHERFHPAGWREFSEDGCYAPYEKREEVHANGSQDHKGRVLIHERAWQALPSEIIVEPCEITLSRSALVVCLNNALLAAVHGGAV